MKKKININDPMPLLLGVSKNNPKSISGMASPAEMTKGIDRF
jgi:hypothetical protein